MNMPFGEQTGKLKIHRVSGGGQMIHRGTLGHTELCKAPKAPSWVVLWPSGRIMDEHTTFDSAREAVVRFLDAQR